MVLIITSQPSVLESHLQGWDIFDHKILFEREEAPLLDTR
jgi:hypothetical protein